MIYSSKQFSLLSVLFTILTFLSIRLTFAEPSDIIEASSTWTDSQIESTSSYEYWLSQDLLEKQQEYLISLALANDVPKSWLSKIITKNQEVIGTYYHGKTLRNAYSLTSWKYEIMEKIWLVDAQKLHYQVMNNLECWDEDGYCVWANIWPFQINRQYHPIEWNKSLELIKAKKREELYEYQLRWTVNRSEDYKKRMCNAKWPKENEIFRCMMIVHNWNNKAVAWTNLKFKDVYAMKWLEIKAILVKIMNSKDPD